MAASSKGRLLLVPNVLDQAALNAEVGSAAGVALDQALPLAVIQAAARITHWVVETPKVARAFLKQVDARVGLSQPLQSLHLAELPRPAKGGAKGGARASGASGDALWLGLLQPALEGHDLGLLSDAGLPAVADPGADLVAAAHAAGIAVWPLAGPSSLLLTLAASGLNGQSFAFHGYLPIDAQERQRRLQALEVQSRQGRQTQLLIETPYRNAALWAALLQVLRDDTWLSVGCGLTGPTGFCRTLRVAQWRRTPLSLPSDQPAVFALLA